MKKDHNETNTVESKNQSGGITAQNVTINHNNYAPFSRTFEKIKITVKHKFVKWPLLLIAISGLAVGSGRLVFSSRIDTKEEFYKFLLRYQESVSKNLKDAEDYFADNINIFYTKNNISPAEVNKERGNSDYRDGENNIDQSSITLRKADDINYWRYKGAMICWRPTKNMYQKCMVEMEFGLNSDDRIVSIKQVGFWDLNYTKEKPNW